MIKMVDNTFHALKVAFANEIGRIAGAASVDVDQLITMFIADRKLNVSEAYLRPGMPFGGSCLPKDVAALCAFAGQHDLEVPLIGHVTPSNTAHQAALTRRVLDALPAGASVLLAGLTFKAKTDDLRESPLVYLARSVLDRGHPLMIYDQDLIGCELVGENLHFVRRHLPEIAELLVDDLDVALSSRPVVVRAKPLPVPVRRAHDHRCQPALAEASAQGLAAWSPGPWSSATTRSPGTMDVGRSDHPLKIAIVYSRLPLPMDRADQMTIAHLVAFLARRGHAVDLWTLDNGEAITTGQRAWLEGHCRRVETFKHGLLRRLWGTGRGLLAGLPLQCGWFANARQTAAVRAAAFGGDYDVLYTYGIRSAGVLRRMFAPPPSRPVSYLAMQVSQALNTRRIFEHSGRLRDKVIYGLEYLLTRRYEARIWEDFPRVVLIGPEDVRTIETLCREMGRAPIDNYIYGPHGVDLKRFTPSDGSDADPATVLFCGSLRTNTNIDAITWFVTQVWPLVIGARPELRLLIVGRSPSMDVRRLGRVAGVEVVGDVPDVAPFHSLAAVCVNPVRACAGQQNKLLEYMAMGKAIVATSYANEGIGAVGGRDLLLADEPRAFADQVLLLLGDPRRRTELGAAARAFVTAHWSWEALFLQLERSFYKSLDVLPQRREGVAALAPSAPARFCRS